jgi:hypothetical protein
MSEWMGHAKSPCRTRGNLTNLLGVFGVFAMLPIVHHCLAVFPEPVDNPIQFLDFLGQCLDPLLQCFILIRITSFLFAPQPSLLTHILEPTGRVEPLLHHYATLDE